MNIIYVFDTSFALFAFIIDYAFLVNLSNELLFINPYLFQHY